MTPVRLFNTTADATPAVEFTVPAGQRILWEAVILQNPVGGAATVVTFTVGSAAVLIQSVPAGPTPPIILYPRMALNAGDTITIGSSVTDDVCVVEGTGMAAVI